MVLLLGAVFAMAGMAVIIIAAAAAQAHRRLLLFTI
jgi:hypothetical protein